MQATKAISSHTGAPLKAYGWQFTVAVSSATAIFASHPVTPSFSGNADITDMALGDLNGDGDLDAVVANASNDDTSAVLANDNDGVETVWINRGPGGVVVTPTTGLTTTELSSTAIFTVT